MERKQPAKWEKKGRATISSFSFYERRWRKIDGLNVGLLPTCWGKNERKTHSGSQVVFFSYTTLTTQDITSQAQQQCPVELRSNTHTHTHSWLVEGHISEMLDPTNSSFSVLLENPLPFPRPFWLCLNVHLSHSLARCIFKGTADFVHTVHEKLSNSIIMQKPFWCAVFLYTICCHVFL